MIFCKMNSKNLHGEAPVRDHDGRYGNHDVQEDAGKISRWNKATFRLLSIPRLLFPTLHGNCDLLRDQRM